MTGYEIVEKIAEQAVSLEEQYGKPAYVILGTNAYGIFQHFCKSKMTLPAVYDAMTETVEEYMIMPIGKSVRVVCDPTRSKDTVLVLGSPHMEWTRSFKR